MANLLDVLFPNTKQFPRVPEEKDGHKEYIVPVIVVYILKFVVGVFLVTLRYRKTIWHKIIMVLIIIVTIGEVVIFNLGYFVKEYLLIESIAHVLMLIFLICENTRYTDIVQRFRYNRRQFNDDADMESLLTEETPPTTWRSGYSRDRDDGSTTCTPRRTPRPPCILYDGGMCTSSFGRVTAESEIIPEPTTKQPKLRSIPENIRSLESSSSSSDQPYSSVKKHASVSPQPTLVIESSTDSKDGLDEIPLHAREENYSIAASISDVTIDINSEDGSPDKAAGTSMLPEGIMPIPIDLFKTDHIPKEWQEWEESKKRESPHSGNNDK